MALKGKVFSSILMKIEIIIFHLKKVLKVGRYNMNHITICLDLKQFYT